MPGLVSLCMMAVCTYNLYTDDTYVPEDAPPTGENIQGEA